MDSHTKSRKLNWPQIKLDYIKGDNTYSELAERYGVSAETIISHANDKRGKGNDPPWATLREEFKAKTTAKFLEVAQERAIALQVDVQLKHVQIHEEIVTKLYTKTLAAIDAGEIEPTDMLKALNVYLSSERKVHKLDDKPASTIEMTKDNDGGHESLSIKFSTEQLADSQRAIAAFYGALNAAKQSPKDSIIDVSPGVIREHIPEG